MSQYIDRKTVLNLVYTQQATRMADAYENLLADFSQMTAWGRGLESDLSHARVEISFLKAEVERLTAMADENAHLHKGIYSLSLNVLQLKDENERLRKAGDAMQKRLYVLENPTHPEVYLKLLSAWNAAKEGTDR